MNKLILLFPCLLLSVPATALTLQGELQPDRYTYYLAQEYSHKLKELNDTHPDKWPHLAATDLQPATVFYKSGKKPAPQAITCISSLFYNKYTHKNQLNIGCIDDNGLEYKSNLKWPSKSIAESVCKVGTSGCESYLKLESETWSEGPQ